MDQAARCTSYKRHAHFDTSFSSLSLAHIPARRATSILETSTRGAKVHGRASSFFGSATHGLSPPRNGQQLRRPKKSKIHFLVFATIDESRNVIAQVMLAGLDLYRNIFSSSPRLRYFIIIWPAARLRAHYLAGAFKFTPIFASFSSQPPTRSGRWYYIFHFDVAAHFDI